MILLIDNYDSFVYNIARYIECLGYACRVVRNDAITLEEIIAASPSHIVLSPGPCTPDEAGICVEVVTALASSFPILGICLGHQVIGQAFGGRIVRAPEPTHGKMRHCHHDGRGVFHDVPNPLPVGLYHSLCVSDVEVPSSLSVTARSDNGTIMALAHRDYPCVGLQFHPESILTSHGDKLLANFLAGAPHGHE